MRPPLSPRFLVAGAALLTLLVACGGDSTGVVPCVVSTTVSPSSLNLEVGQTGGLALNVARSGGCSTPSTTWSSSSETIATVSSSGQVTALSAGTATVTALVADAGASASSTATVTVVNVPVSTLTMAPGTAAMIVGGTTTLTATAKDLAGNTLTGRTATWSSSATAVATVTDGVVRAVAPGTATITASVEGKSASATVTVDAARFAFAWANDKSAASYTPNAGHSYNSTGGAIAITRQSTGRYAVRFAGLAKGPQQGTQVREVSTETVIVSAFGDFFFGTDIAVCRVLSWVDSGSDLVVSVQCETPAGVPMDSGYTVLLVGAGALEGPNGFLWTSSLDDDYSPNALYAWNRTGGAMRVTKAAVAAAGRWVDFGFVPTSTRPITYLATSYGSGSHWCTPVGLNRTEARQQFACRDASGAVEVGPPRFSALLASGGRPGRRAGFAFVRLPSEPTQGSAPGYEYNTGGGAVTITRDGVGRYWVAFPGLAGAAGDKDIVVVSPFGYTRHCTILTWGGNQLAVGVQCFDRTGAPADAQFFVALFS